MKSTTRKHSERVQYFTCGVATIEANRPARETAIDKAWQTFLSAWNKWSAQEEHVVLAPEVHLHSIHEDVTQTAA